MFKKFQRVHFRRQQLLELFGRLFATRKSANSMRTQAAELKILIIHSLKDHIQDGRKFWCQFSSFYNLTLPHGLPDIKNSWSFQVPPKKDQFKWKTLSVQEA